MLNTKADATIGKLLLEHNQKLFVKQMKISDDKNHETPLHIAARLNQGGYLYLSFLFCFDWLNVEEEKVLLLLKMGANYLSLDRKSTRLNSSHPSISYA